MKKVIVILLLFFYSAATIGATVNMHYCMNKFAGYSLSTIKKDKCSKCGMNNSKKNSCCKDEKKQIKLSNDQQKTTLNNTVNILFTSVVNVTPVYINSYSVLNTFILYAHREPPPLIPKQGIQALYATFLI